MNVYIVANIQCHELTKQVAGIVCECVVSCLILSLYVILVVVHRIFERRRKRACRNLRWLARGPRGGHPSCTL